MKYNHMIATAVLGAGLLVGSTSLTSAAVLTVRQVMTQCPDLGQAKACPPMATRFLDGRPNDGQIVNLVIALAEAGQTPRVPMPVCLNVADGLRVLADGLSNAGQTQQVRDIADSLCKDTSTAAIGGGGGRIADSGPPPSLASDGGSSPPSGPPAATVPDENPPADDPPADDPPADDPPADDPPADDPPADDPPADDPPADDPPADDPPADNPQNCNNGSGNGAEGCDATDNPNANDDEGDDPCAGLSGSDFGQCKANRG